MKIGIEDIKQLVDIVTESGIGELLVEEDGTKIKISAKAEPKGVSLSVPAISPAVQPQAAAAPEQAAASPELSGQVVKSPIVGTFYEAAAPDKPPYVTVGKRVKKGDVLFIIESMKLMNEIQSEFDGEVAEILVSNGDTVEYGQPIMLIK